VKIWPLIMVKFAACMGNGRAHVKTMMRFLIIEASDQCIIGRGSIENRDKNVQKRYMRGRGYKRRYSTVVKW